MPQSRESTHLRRRDRTSKPIEDERRGPIGAAVIVRVCVQLVRFVAGQAAVREVALDVDQLALRLARFDQRVGVHAPWGIVLARRDDAIEKIAQPGPRGRSSLAPSTPNRGCSIRVAVVLVRRSDVRCGQLSDMRTRRSSPGRLLRPPRDRLPAGAQRSELLGVALERRRRDDHARSWVSIIAICSGPSGWSAVSVTSRQ